MANLLIGFGGFGSKILRYIHKKNILGTIPGVYETLLIDDDGKSSDYPFPTAITVRGLGVIESNAGLRTKEDLLYRIHDAKRVIIFAGIGGSFTCEALYELIHTTMIDKNKLYIVAISPFSFEGHAKAAIAKETLKTIIDAQIGCGVFANEELIDQHRDHEVIARMEAFNDKIIASIPW
jgi:cell division GTPase FtsZ